MSAVIKRASHTLMAPWQAVAHWNAVEKQRPQALFCYQELTSTQDAKRSSLMQELRRKVDRPGRSQITFFNLILRNAT